MDCQRVYRNCNALLVTHLTRDVQTVLDERIAQRIVSLLACQDTGGKKRAFPGPCGCCRFRKFQELAQSVSAFSQVLAHLPKAKHRSAETQAPLCVSGFYQPIETRAKIVMFQGEAVQPFRAAIIRSLFFRQYQAVGSMGAFR